MRVATIRHPPARAASLAGKPEGDPMTVQGHYNVCRDAYTLRDLPRGTCRAAPHGTRTGRSG
jgi:ribulose-bisphosphate carboxylase large chain